MGANSSHSRHSTGKRGTRPFGLPNSKLFSNSAVSNGRLYDNEGELKNVAPDEAPQRQKDSRGRRRHSHGRGDRRLSDDENSPECGKSNRHRSNKNHSVPTDCIEDYTCSESGSPSRSTDSRSSSYDSSDTASTNSEESSNSSHSRQSTAPDRGGPNEGDVEMEVEVLTNTNPNDIERKPKSSLATNKSSKVEKLHANAKEQPMPSDKSASKPNTDQVIEEPFKSRVTCRDIGLTETETGLDGGVRSVHSYSAFIKMDSDVLWKRTKTTLERRLRGMQLKYKCTIKLGDRPQTYGTDTVYSVNITGPSDEAVMRCRSSLPDSILKRLITAYWHLDEEIEYGKSFSSNTKQKGLLNSVRRPVPTGKGTKPPTMTVPAPPPNLARLMKK
jgi:hypothetical protein